MEYKYLTSNIYYFDANSRLIRINHIADTIKFKQINYTIASVTEEFNGYSYLTVYKGEAIRQSGTKIKKYKIEVIEDEDGNKTVSRSIYYRNIK